MQLKFVDLQYILSGVFGERWRGAIVDQKQKYY